MLTCSVTEKLEHSIGKSPIGENGKAKISIAGVTGYVGQELLRLLMLHPAVELVTLASTSHEGQSLETALPGFAYQTDKICQAMDLSKMANESDIVFLALPHGISSDLITDEILQKTKVIDLSGDFRLKKTYGLPELYKDAIKNAALVANPGCYATAAILSLIPLIKANLIVENGIVIDGKSGVSGAGRAAALNTQFSECNESMKAYQLPVHRHTPEIEQTLGQFATKEVLTTFAAHLVPMNRGILLTAYATLKEQATSDDVTNAFKSFYENKPFVRLKCGTTCLPETRWVKGSNYCDIAFTVDERCNRVVIVSALDNLIKGAAGQAVQNMNIMLGLDETTGLKQIPTFL